MSKILSAPTLPKEKLTPPLPEKIKIHLLIYNFTRSRLFANIVLDNLFLNLFGIFANIVNFYPSSGVSICPPNQREGCFSDVLFTARRSKRNFYEGKGKGGKREKGVSGNDPNRLLLLRGEKGPGKK